MSADQRNKEAVRRVTAAAAAAAGAAADISNICRSAPRLRRALDQHASMVEVERHKHVRLKAAHARTYRHTQTQLGG